MFKFQVGDIIRSLYGPYFLVTWVGENNAFSLSYKLLRFDMAYEDIYGAYSIECSCEKVT